MASESDNRRTWFPGAHRVLIDSTGDLINTPLAGPGNLEQIQSQDELHMIEASAQFSHKNRQVDKSPVGPFPDKPKKLSMQSNHAAQPAKATPAPTHERYQTLYEIQFCCSNFFPVAQSVSTASEELVLIQTLTGLDAEDQLQCIKRIQHPRFLKCQDIFSVGEFQKVAFEFMPVSLAEFAGNPLINELVLASIVGQILEGLSYLEENHLEHGHLTASNLLVDASGNIKIWGYERSQRFSKPGSDIKALSVIMMELMQGYAKEDGIVGIDDPNRWPYDSDAVQFLSMTTFETKTSKFQNHALLRCSWGPSRIKGAVSLVNLWSSRGYKVSF